MIVEFKIRPLELGMEAGRNGVWMLVERQLFEQSPRVDRPPSFLCFATQGSLPATQGQRSAYLGCGTSQPDNSGTMSLMSTLEEIEAAIQQLPPAKRAEFRAWFFSFDASDWDQQMEDDLTAGTLDWLANEAISDSLSGRCSEL